MYLAKTVLYNGGRKRAKEKNTMELGLKIKELRTKHGFTQEELAEKLGVSFQTISKWENLVSMPDISLLPKLSEIFGITIDDLFNLSVEQKMKRIESKFGLEEELKPSDFSETEEFLKSYISEPEHRYQATYLLAYLYTHRLMADARKASRYSKQAIKLDPTKKDCQWMIGKAEAHYCWDWDMSNHNNAINFYREVVEENSEVSLPYYYLIDNLLADHRADEAEYYLDKLEKLRPDAIVMTEAYRAGIALARYNEKEADRIMTDLEKNHIDEDGCLFEIAQYYAKKGQFEKSISYYEKSFETTNRRPRFIDELLSIATIYDILKDYKKEAETYDRIIKCYKEEWNMSEEFDITDMEKRKMDTLQKIK